MTELMTQMLGLLGAALCILSLQCKDNRKYFVGQALSGLCFAVHFYLLGAYTGALINLVNVGRGFGFAAERSEKPNVTLAASCVLYVTAAALTFDGILSVLACVAQLIGSYAMWTRKPTRIRVLQVACISPMWLTYNGLTGSLGGVCCEAFNILSVAVYFVRVRLLPRFAKK